MTITTLVLVNSLQRLLRLMKRCYGFRSARRLHKLCFRPRRKRRRRSTSHKLGLAPRLRSRDRGPKISAGRTRAALSLRRAAHEMDWRHDQVRTRSPSRGIRPQFAPGGANLVHAQLMRPIGRSRNVVRMLAATLGPERCNSGHCGKFCRWSHLISSAQGQRNC